jgi:PAS domain S-box-containing protein
MDDPDAHDNDSSTTDASRFDVPRTILRGVLNAPLHVRRSYLLKFTIALCSIVLIIGVGGYLMQAQATTTLNETVEQKLRLEAQAEADRINEQIRGNEIPARTLSDHPALNQSQGRVHTYLEKAKRNKLPDRIEGLHVVNTVDETVVESTDPDRVGDDLSNRSWIRKTAFPNDDKVVTSEPYTNESGESVMAFMSPIPQRTNWALVLVVNPKTIREDFDSSIDGAFTEVVKPTPGSTKVLFSNRAAGRLEPYVPEKSRTEIPVVRRGLEGESGFRTTGVKERQLDGDYIVAYAPVERKQWVVVKHAPVEASYRLRDQIRDGLFLFITVALVALGIVGFILGRQTVTPLSELRDRAEQMEEGDLSVELETERTDEIGRLYHSFASMRDELAAKIQESEQARERAERNAREAEEARAEAESLAAQLKEEKERSDEQLRTLFETAPDPVVMVSEDGTIEKVNPAFASLFGVDEEDIVDTAFTDVGLTPTDRVAEIVETLQSDDPDAVAGETYTLTYEREDGDPATIELNADLFVDDGEVIGWVGILRDVTERERQRRQLEEKNDRLERFASIVSHDLRNPLNVASGYLEAAKAQYDAEDSGPLVEIEWAHDQMYQLIDELLTLARQGETITDTTTVEPHEIASEAWDAVDTEAASFDLAAEIDSVDADESRLSQLFENLFRNAIDHNSEDVTVSVGELPDGGGFFIEDDGSGIPESEREEIFEHGYTTAEDGTGFGLSIVDKIATAHGWSVELTESDQGGARFEIHTTKRDASVSLN